MNDIERAIEMLKSQIELSGMSYYGFSDEDCKLAELIIRILEKQLTDGWILCSERLPEDSNSYLVQFSYGYENSKDWCEVIHFQHNCKKWKRLNHLAVKWQPLPPLNVES